MSPKKPTDLDLIKYVNFDQQPKSNGLIDWEW